jgi:hypothetical protein
MTKRLLSVLLLSAAFPLAAVAQTSNGDAGTTITNPGTPADSSAAEPMEPASGPSATTAGPFVTVPETGAWRVSDFEGKQVYGTDGESIGSISDVLVSQNGSVNAVIIGVGGFLGIGAKDVAVDMTALELGPGATQADADAASAATPEATPGDVSDETTASTESVPPAAAPVPGAEPDVAANNTGNPATTGTGMPATGDDQQMAANEAGNIQIGEDGLPERIVLNVTRQQLEDAPAFEGMRGEAQEQ